MGYFIDLILEAKVNLDKELVKGEESITLGKILQAFYNEFADKKNIGYVSVGKLIHRDYKLTGKWLNKLVTAGFLEGEMGLYNISDLGKEEAEKRNKISKVIFNKL